MPDGQPGAGAGGHRTGRADQAGEGQRGRLPEAAAALQRDGHPDADGAAARAGSGAAGRRGAGREPARLGRGGPRELARLGMRPRPHRREAVITEPATPRVCRLSRAGLEATTGSAIRFPGDLEVVMSSFTGVLQLTEDDAVWRIAGEPSTVTAAPRAGDR